MVQQAATCCTPQLCNSNRIFITQQAGELTRLLVGECYERDVNTSLLTNRDNNLHLSRWLADELLDKEQVEIFDSHDCSVDAWIHSYLRNLSVNTDDRRLTMSNRQVLLEEVVGSLVDDSDQEMRVDAADFLSKLSGVELYISTLVMKQAGSVSRDMLSKLIAACDRGKNLTPRQQNWQRGRWEGFVWGLCYAWNMTESQVAELIAIQLPPTFDWSCLPNFYLHQWKSIYRKSLLEDTLRGRDEA